MAQLPAAIGAKTPRKLLKNELDLSSAADYAAAEKAASTRKAYRSDWLHFSAWCFNREVQALPAETATIVAYLANIADSGLSASTIGRRLAAIGYAHKLQGFEPPGNAEAVRAVVRGIRRRIGTAVTQKAPATAIALTAMLEKVGTGLAGLRDRALLLIGFAAALRRSELVDLKVNDIEISEEGAIVRLRRSKTDQEGAGAEIAIPRGTELKPVEALEAWLSALTLSLNCTECLTTSPLFRPIGKGGRVKQTALSDKSVADIVKRYAAAAGLDPKLFAGHSLRAGFVTSALDHGADLFKVMDVTRHRRVDTLKGYDRRARAFRDHAGKDFL